jgi:hypothetical protein
MEYQPRLRLGGRGEAPAGGPAMPGAAGPRPRRSTRAAARAGQPSWLAQTPAAASSSEPPRTRSRSPLTAGQGRAVRHQQHRGAAAAHRGDDQGEVRHQQPGGAGLLAPAEHLWGFCGIPLASAQPSRAPAPAAGRAEGRAEERGRDARQPQRRGTHQAVGLRGPGLKDGGAAQVVESMGRRF